MQKLTLQLFNHGRWHDAAELIFHDNVAHGRVTLAYTHAYIAEVLQYEAIDSSACTVNAPVGVVPTDYPTWPALLNDLLPVGKSRDWWLARLDLKREPEFVQNIELLKHAVMAPIGNLRIKEAFLSRQNAIEQRFPLQAVVELQHDFLEYANENGAAVGGATGAVGVAPKLLLMVEGEQVYIDGDFVGKPLAAKPYLTKFARNRRTRLDNDILAAESCYYKVLAKLLAGSGIETIDTENMMVYQHEGQVSLWLPRFDVVAENGFAKRIGVESIYSIINAGPGSAQNHLDVMTKVWAKIRRGTQMSKAEFAKQYLARDLLNLVFGNSDNHGRNISFLKLEGDIRFAPIYDFAPMKADPEMVVRLFKWPRQFESASIVKFDQVVQELNAFAPAEELLAFLKTTAKKLVHLKDELRLAGCSERILDFPAIGLERTREKLIEMGVFDA